MNGSMPALQMAPAEWEIVRDILWAHVPQHQVWAFGSRVTGKAKPYSDLDLAIVTSSPLPLDTAAALNEALSESDLPWKVDIVDWSEISADFQQIIQRDKIILQNAASEGASHVGSA